MKTVKDIKYLINEVTNECNSLKKNRTVYNQKSTDKEITKLITRLNFYRDILTYLESDPREEYLRAQEAKLISRIMVVDDKITILDATYRTRQALSNAIKSLKAEFNYDKNKKQLEVIQFILN
jgi:hypothetical protein